MLDSHGPVFDPPLALHGSILILNIFCAVQTLGFRSDSHPLYVRQGLEGRDRQDIVSVSVSRLAYQTLLTFISTVCDRIP